VLSKRTVAFIFVLSAGAIEARASAQMCRSVFINESQIVQDLARLRLELDKEQVEGADSPSVMQVLSQRYDDSVRYFVENKIFTPDALKALIRSEISKLQNENKKQDDSINAAKEAERLVLENRIAKPMPAILSDQMIKDARMAFVDKHSALIYKTKRGVEIYRFNGEPEVLVDSASFAYDFNADRLLYIDKHLKLHSRSLADGTTELIGRVEMGLDPSRMKMELSPSGDKFALFLEDRIEIFNARTGKVIATNDANHGTAIGLSIRNARFIDDNFLLYDGGQKLYRLDIANNKRDIYSSHAAGINRWEISGDRRYAVIEARRDILVKNLLTDHGIGYREYFNGEGKDRNFTFVNGVSEPIVFVRHFEQLGFYKMTNFEANIFKFDGSFSTDIGGDRSILNVFVSENGKKAVVLFEDSLSKKIFSEIWSVRFDK